MKFCKECGSKLIASNGMPPKFCGNCAAPTGGEPAKANVEKESFIEEDSYEEILEIEDEKSSQTMSFESLVGSGKTNVNRGSQKGIASIDEFKKRMEKNDPLDA